MLSVFTVDQLLASVQTPRVYHCCGFTNRGFTNRGFSTVKTLAHFSKVELVFASSYTCL